MFQNFAHLDDGPLPVLDSDGEGEHDSLWRVIGSVAEDSHAHVLAWGDKT